MLISALFEDEKNSLKNMIYCAYKSMHKANILHKWGRFERDAGKLFVCSLKEVFLIIRQWICIYKCSPCWDNIFKLNHFIDQIPTCSSVEGETFYAK